MVLQGNLEGLTTELIGKQVFMDKNNNNYKKIKPLCFKSSAGALGTTCASVVTLIMQGLCDAISKGSKSSNKPLRETPRLCTRLPVYSRAQNEGRRHATDTSDGELSHVRPAQPGDG